jgi:DNA-binding XRE family transcriptional regulator
LSCPKGKLFYICFVQTEKKQRRPLDELELKTFGESSSVERIKLESGYESFKIGLLIHNTRLELGLTQEELAERVGTSKSYISKIENNIKEVRISTLIKIIKNGFGAHLELNIKRDSN